MDRDPIVAEIHAIRAKLYDECGGDLNKLMDRYRAIESQHGDRLVTKDEVLRARRERGGLRRESTDDPAA